MKKQIIILGFVSCVLSANAHDEKDTLLTDDQLRIRTDLMSFLTEEGNKPQLYSFNHILFGKEGVPISIKIEKEQTSPFLISCFIHNTFRPLYVLNGH